MIREGEIGMKSSAPGDSREPGTFFTPCILLIEGRFINRIESEFCFEQYGHLDSGNRGRKHQRIPNGEIQPETKNLSHIHSPTALSQLIFDTEVSRRSYMESGYNVSGVKALIDFLGYAAGRTCTS
jgi:hypothetical protein